MYRDLGLVGDQVTIQGEVQRVDGDGRACRGDIQGTEILDVPAMPVVEGEGVVYSGGVVTAIVVQALLVFQVAVTALAVDIVDSVDDRERITR